MDRALLEKVVEELAGVLPGSMVDKVQQGIDGSLIMVLRRLRSRRILLLSPDRALPRFHLLSQRPAAAPSPAGFFLFLRKHLAGARVTGLRTVNQDRVVELGFDKGEASLLLIFELTGAASNIVLVDRDGTILSLLHPRPPAEGHQRTLLPGAHYAPPPQPPLQRKSPALTLSDAGEGTDVPVNWAAERLYDRLVAEQRTNSLRSSLSAMINRALQRTERRIAALAQDRERSGRQGEYQRAGALILASLHQLHKGMEKADLTGFDGMTSSVALDPAKSATENAEAYFRKAKKARTAMTVVQARLDASRDEAGILRSAQEEVLKAADHAALANIRLHLGAAGVLPDRTALRTGQRPPPALSYRRVTFEEWEILVGKNAAGNEHITRRVAQPDDLWLHAEGMPGSHVVVRNPLKRSIPQTVLEKAAALAAYYSRGRRSTKVPVTYTTAGRVRKPAGARPGTVVVSERRTIMAEPGSE